MTEQKTAREPDIKNPPSLLPSASLLLHRSQTTLGLPKEVVQESSADYWFGLGEEAEFNWDWPKAKICFSKALQLKETLWYANLKLGLVMSVELDKSPTTEQDIIKIKSLLELAFSQAHAEHGNLERLANMLDVEQWQFLMTIQPAKEIVKVFFR